MRRLVLMHYIQERFAGCVALRCAARLIKIRVRLLTHVLINDLSFA